MVAMTLAATATGLAAVFLIPQIVRLATRGDAAGVSPVWAAFGVITNAAWVVYLGMMGLWAAVAAPTLAVVTYGVMLAVLGLVLSITPAVQLAPQVMAVFQVENPTGVAPTTWSMAIAEAVLWGCYGWLMRDAALIGYGLVTSVGSVLILGRWMVTRSRWQAPAPRPLPQVEVGV